MKKKFLNIKDHDEEGILHFEHTSETETTLNYCQLSKLYYWTNEQLVVSTPSSHKVYINLISSRSVHSQTTHRSPHPSTLALSSSHPYPVGLNHEAHCHKELTPTTTSTQPHPYHLQTPSRLSDDLYPCQICVLRTNPPIPVHINGPLIPGILPTFFRRQPEPCASPAFI